jgi:hypothetical protein
MKVNLSRRVHLNTGNATPRSLNLEFQKIRKLRSQRKYTQLEVAVRKLKTEYSIRKAAKLLNMTYSYVQKIINAPQCEGGKRKVTKEDRDEVKQFYSQATISQTLPYKRYAQNHYLRMPRAEAYEEYAAEQIKLEKRVLSATSVHNCLPRNFKSMAEVPYQLCKCSTCVNTDLLVKCLQGNGVKGIHKRCTANVCESFCNKREEQHCDTSVRRQLIPEPDKAHITDYPRDCVFRICEACSKWEMYVQRIIEENVDNNINWTKQVSWKQWSSGSSVKVVRKKGDPNVKRKKKTKDKRRQKKTKVVRKKGDPNVKKRIDLREENGTLEELLKKFSESLQKMSTHLFHFRWQASKFIECKEQLQQGKFILLMNVFVEYWLKFTHLYSIMFMFCFRFSQRICTSTSSAIHSIAISNI